MTCPFYGKHPEPLFSILAPGKENECALSGRACNVNPPELDKCEWNGSARAIELEKYTARRPQTNYPD